MAVVFEKPKALANVPLHYCPGCTHGIAHRLVAQALDALDCADNTIGVAPVGCAVFAYDYFNCDMQEAAHGRAPAVATGIKRVCPESVVFTYQGDGDLAAIGLAEITSAAMRGENITVIFINNAIYGMTGGQMAPTTLVGQKATTAPYGRQLVGQGSPIRVSEMIATLDGATYVERVSLHDAANVNRAKRAVEKAFRRQIEKKGFSMVEILSTCPTNWGLSPVEALNYIIKEQMLPVYPLGVLKEE
ncbi:MAG: hypothetical protein IJP30_03445 [Clostridia bacterium]|nr:hypothetical protein [Clostridia bacterium]